jgi:anaerobic selenocysteine-containing dehydrogenase
MRREERIMTEEKITFCRICEVYCGLVATVEDGRITKLRPDEEHVVSRGYACPKGLAAHQVTHDQDRVLHPLKKVDGAWQRISWEHAIAEIAERLNRIRREHGPHAIALYTGNPSGYSYSHRIASANWIAAVGSRNSYGAGSQDNLADFLASRLLYGASFLQPIPDVARTSFLLVVATNPAVSQGTLVHMADAKAQLRAVRARGGKVVVVDPRRTETVRLASEHHFIRPDTDVFLLLAMIRTILAERLEAREFLAAHVEGVDRVREMIDPFTLELGATQTGIPADTIRRLAREFASAPGACAYGRIVCGRFGTLAAWGLEALNILTGNLDRPGGALFSEGLVDLVEVVARMGLDGYGKHRSRVGDYPGVLGELPSGVLADEITTPGAGQIRALVVTAGNPVLSTANGPALAAAMRQLECTVALDIYPSETASLADYILPCTTYFERADYPIFHAQLMTEPYAQWTEEVIPPQGEAKTEWEIFALLSDAMGLPFLNSRVATVVRKALRLFGRDISPRSIMQAMVRLGPYGDRFLPWRHGLTLAEVATHPHGVRLPDPRTGILRQKLRTEDRKIHLWPRELEGEIARLRGVMNEPEDGGFPFRLIGRRDMRSNNSWLHNLPRLMRGDRCRRLRVHPEDAARLGLADGGRARVRSRVTAVEVEVRVTDEVMPGVVSLPHGWGHTYEASRRVAAQDPGPNCNALIDQRVIEPLAGMAFLNGFPVAVEPVAATDGHA